MAYRINPFTGQLDYFENGGTGLSGASQAESTTLDFTNNSHITITTNNNLNITSIVGLSPYNPAFLEVIGTGALTFTNVGFSVFRFAKQVDRFWITLYNTGTKIIIKDAISVPLTDTVPVASNVTISYSALTVGNTLTGLYTYYDDNGDIESGSTFKWYRADDAMGTGVAAIGGATSSTYVLAGADENKYIRFGVTPINANGSGVEYFSSYTAQITNPADVPPVASNVVITGTLQVDELLTGSYDYFDADSDVESGSTYQWYRADDAIGTNVIAIPSATSLTYTLTSSDIGKYVRLGVTPANVNDTGNESFSNYIGAIADVVDLNIWINFTENLATYPVTSKYVNVDRFAGSHALHYEDTTATAYTITKSANLNGVNYNGVIDTVPSGGTKFHEDNAAIAYISTSQNDATGQIFTFDLDSAKTYDFYIYCSRNVSGSRQTRLRMWNTVIGEADVNKTLVVEQSNNTNGNQEAHQATFLNWTPNGSGEIFLQISKTSTETEAMINAIKIIEQA